VPSVERPEPPYLQVVRHLRDRILSGEIPEGEVIPSARKIAKEWGVAHATAAKVLGTLQAEGLVAGKPGVGTVVTARHRSTQERLTSVHRTGLIYPEGHYAKIRSAEMVTAPDYIAEALNIQPDSPVIRRQRTTYSAEDIPQSTSVSWFDGKLADQCPKLLVCDRIKNGTVGYIAEMTGRTLARAGHDALRATRASAEVANELQVSIDAPVLMVRNHWTDEANWVAEVGESISPENRWLFYYYEIESGK